MKQVVQNYKTGELKLLEVPVPVVRRGGVLVRNVNSFISVGTEKLMINLARKNVVGKALARPDLVRQVIDKVKNEGLKEAYRQATNRLDIPVPLGYSSSGVVMEIGEGVDEFSRGDRVACAGHGYASHAEVVFVPKNLCVKIPRNVSFEEAASVTVGAIALHSVRMTELTLGENVVVIGLGLLGQIAVQILNGSGCNVFGIDIDEGKVSLAMELGADSGAVLRKDNVPIAVKDFSKGYGADAVIIFASTATNEPLELAAEISRKCGRIVAAGMIKLNIPRKLFYEKELRVIVPKSSGPGVDDSLYERKGMDYPLSYIRWTERRNMQQFLELISRGKVRLNKIITHRFKIEAAEQAYRMISGRDSERHIGVLLCYGDSQPQINKVRLKEPHHKITGTKEVVNVGLIGAGLFARTTILPLLKRAASINMRAVATATGITGRHVGEKFGFEYTTSDYRKVLDDSVVDCVIIATRHNLHAKLVIEALRQKKDVFVEKPLAISISELNEIIKVGKDNPGKLMVGFNRRFSPFSVKAKDLLGNADEPIIMNCRINAGFIPRDSWIKDPLEGGGRIIGEVCHFIDLIQYFANSVPVRVYAETTLGGSENPVNDDNLIITVRLQNGSIASIVYVAKADKSFPRERVEILGSDCVCTINNFKSLFFTRGGKRKKMRRFNVDRGHKEEFSIFLSAVRKGEKLPVDFREYVLTTLATFCIVESLKKGTPIDVDPAVLKL